jgi:DedD protein
MATLEARMDNRVRDLDQIQEDDGEHRGRRLGTFILAGTAVVGLTLALGVVVGRAAEGPAKPDDPLAKLERAANGGAHKPSTTAKSDPVAPAVETADMTFPSTLADAEDRPEVLAALNAAAAEEAALSDTGTTKGAPTPAPSAKAEPGPSAQAAAHPAANGDDEDADMDQKPEVAKIAAPDKITQAEMVARIPAAVAAGTSARSLRKVVEQDPMVAAAIHAEAPKSMAAPHGHEGEFTLQVISYDRPEPSRAFAEGLRAKGHMAFVVTAEIPDRGRYFRVRLGPFKSREQAEAYRHKFEDAEHMNTFVVREKDESEKHVSR